MSKGFPFALFSGALWGILLVAPEWLYDFSVTDITAGRFLVFGILVFPVLLFRWDSVHHLKPGDGLRYLLLSLFGNILFYLFLAGSVRFTGVLPACFLVGALPALGWNGLDVGWKGRHASMPALGVMVLAMVLILLAHDNQRTHGQESDGITGISLLLGASVCWWLSALIQTRLARYNRYLDHSDHFLLTGIMIFPALLLLTPFLLIDSVEFGLLQQNHSSDRNQMFWLIMLILALMCTLLVRMLWKQTAKRVASHQWHWQGMWKSVFGIVYAYFLENRLPEGMEITALFCFGVGLILYGRQRSDDQCL